MIVNENGIVEAKRQNAVGDLPDLLPGVGPSVARVRPKRFNRNGFDLQGSPLFRFSGKWGRNKASP
jgi:hypothetical protein